MGKSNCNCSIIIYCKQLFAVIKNVLYDLYQKRNDYKAPQTKRDCATGLHALCKLCSHNC